MSNDFNVCPKCQSKNIQNKNQRKWFCPDCGFDLYNNVAAAVGLIIQDIDGSIIFEVRAKEPRKGFLALPGGFCDPDESAEQTAFRECQEETGIKPDSLNYITSFPNTYIYKDITYKTCDLFFQASFNSTDKSIIEQMAGEESEVTAFKSIRINSESDIDSLPIAFESSVRALKVWFCQKNKFRNEKLDGADYE